MSSTVQGHCDPAFAGVRDVFAENLAQGLELGAAFGHTGAGGPIGLGDPAAGLALAYLPNLMGNLPSGDLRAHRLTQAAYASLG